MKELEKLVKLRDQPSSSNEDQFEWMLKEHRRILNQSPPPELLRTNKQYGNKYLPLEAVEFILDSLYIHRQVVVPFPPVYVEGQMLWVVNLIVHHPVTDKALTYSGQACVPVIAAEHENMKYNHRNIPAGESFAIMNAAKKIGKIFNVDREDYVDVMEPYFNKGKNKVSPEFDRLKRMKSGGRMKKEKMAETIRKFFEEKKITREEYQELITK
jgi:hypothetical protein